MFVYLVRHAWAGQSGDPRFANDSLRPLTDKGKSDSGG
jgi:phosphohistidine phosphatase SixA